MPKSLVKAMPKKSFFKTIFSKLQNIFTNKQKGIYKKSAKNNQGNINNNIQKLSNKIVEDVMIPRADIIAVSDNSTVEEICSTIIKHGHTRTLVFNNSLDNIVGFIHIKDLFTVVANGQDFALKNLIRQHIVSPHSMKLIDLLTEMKINRTHIAVVVDEYGGTDGVITIEDIIEEIVGRIDDEHDVDTKKQALKLVCPGVIIANARVDIDQIESVMGIALNNKADDIDTIGGLVMSISGCVPSKGVIVDLGNNILVEILESTKRTIKQVKITYSSQ